MSYNKATSYRFELTVLSTGAITTIDRPLQWFRFNMLQSYTAGAAYSIRVAVMTAGHYSPYGPSCKITAPGNLSSRVEIPQTAVAEFKAVASPNPFADTFLVRVTSDSDEPVRLQVYDMIGKLLEVRDTTVSDLQHLAIGQRYPSGVYNIIVSQGRTLKNIRVVKR